MNTTDYATGAGLMKGPEFAWDFKDGLTFQVAADISVADITGGNFIISTGATLDTSLWPQPGHVFINYRLFKYLTISGSQFVDCNGVFGSRATVAIAEGEVGYQAMPETIGNLLLNTAVPRLVYQASDQTGLNWTVASFTMMDGTTELTDYAGAAIVLTNATNYIYAYNNAGAAAVGVNTTSWANPGIPLLPLAKIVMAAGVLVSYKDMRLASLLSIPGVTSGAPSNAKYVTVQAEGGLSAEVSLGALTSGMLKHTVAGAVSTPATAVEGTDYWKPGGTDVAVADGGTGASDASGARTNLGLVIGTNVQAWDADLDALAALAATAGMLSRTGAGAFAARTLAVTIAGIAPGLSASWTNPTGAAGNPSLQITYSPILQRTARGDANYTVLTTDMLVALNVALTANRTWTLPLAATAGPGFYLYFKDETGSLGANRILLTPAGADTIDGVGAAYGINIPFQSVTIYSDGVAGWWII